MPAESHRNQGFLIGHIISPECELVKEKMQDIGIFFINTTTYWIFRSFWEIGYIFAP